MTWAVPVTNIKGGTGKSTIAEQVAYELRDRGHETGLMDADIDSANLATRLGSDEMVEYEGDHTIKPVEHKGIKLFSMENAFDDASFSQSGEFMAAVVKDMVQSSAWGDIDYLVVDCPPGSSDVFSELVRSLRANMLGAVSVGISDAWDDTARLTKVCGHEWVPIIGYVENMSGVYCHGEPIGCDNADGDAEEHLAAPFGQGKIKEFAEQVDGEFLGDVPLCSGRDKIPDVAGDTIDNIADAIEDAEQPELPEDNIGDKNFIRSVWGTISGGIKQMNSELNIGELQDRFGVEGRDPITLELELTDAGAVTGLFSKIIITFDDGELKVMRPTTAKRRGIDPEGGIRMTSQDLSYAVNGEKKVLNAATGDVVTEPYSVIDAVKMGDAEVWGERTVNRLSVLDRILSDVVPMTEVQEIMDSG